MTEAEFIAKLRPLESYLKRMAVAITRNPADAQDALQEGVLAAFVAREKLRDPSLFKPWIKKIIAHQCGRQIRKRGQVIPMGLPGDYTLNCSEGGSDAWLIWDQVARLPELYAQIIIMRYAADLKQAEIAQALDIPVGTVKSRLHNALGKLRMIFQERDGEADEVSRC